MRPAEAEKNADALVARMRSVLAQAAEGDRKARAMVAARSEETIQRLSAAGVNLLDGSHPEVRQFHDDREQVIRTWVEAVRPQIDDVRRGILSALEALPLAANARRRYANTVEAECSAAADEVGRPFTEHEPHIEAWRQRRIDASREAEQSVRSFIESERVAGRGESAERLLGLHLALNELASAGTLTARAALSLVEQFARAGGTPDPRFLPVAGDYIPPGSRMTIAESCAAFSAAIAGDGGTSATPPEEEA
jgi:hypothetical protein